MKTSQPDGKNAIPWQKIVSKYQTPKKRASAWQIVNSFIPYAVLWFLTWGSLAVSYWLTLALAILAAGFLVRIFIILHDCGHGSFFKSKKASSFWGFVAGVLTFTPYHQWRFDHAVHHATCGDLDRRGVGDVQTLTVQEYLGLSRGKRFAYRIYRNPLVLFTVGSLYLFLIRNRLPTPGAAKRERHSVHWTNLAILAAITALSLGIGFTNFVLVQAPISVVAMISGVWLFYVQHQFEGVYWERHDKWDYTKAALQGSSFYQLPRVLQWFTGNIGFHHIHHLSPRIPNYKLATCHEENPILQQAPKITLWSSLRSFKLRLWDEDSRKLVGYRFLKTARHKQALVH
jgi:omega-6 fatty acid desaturase (delta-12 desaturase)